MKAIVQTRYGPPAEVLEAREVERPEPAKGEVLVRIRASTVAGDDWHLMRGIPYVARLATGLCRPRNRVPGLDVAGVVESVGPEATEFEPGDPVFGWCRGGWAEFVAVPEGNLAPKPAGLSFEEAAAIPISGFTALQGVRDRGETKAGHRVLVNGASGGVGTFAVQIAKALGAHVTGVCGAAKADLVASLGADRVIDYAKEDFTRGDERWDVIVDLAGNRKVKECRRALAEKGTLVMVGTSPAAKARATPEADPTAGRLRMGFGRRWFMGVGGWLGAMAVSPFVSHRLRPLVHEDRKEDLLFLADLVEAGRLTPVVDRTFPLEDVLEAIRHVTSGRAAGKVAVRPS